MTTDPGPRPRLASEGQRRGRPGRRRRRRCHGCAAIARRWARNVLRTGGLLGITGHARIVGLPHDHRRACARRRTRCARPGCPSSRCPCSAASTRSCGRPRPAPSPRTASTRSPTWCTSTTSGPTRPPWPRRSATPWSSSSTAGSARAWASAARSRRCAVRDGLSFLDIIARQVLALREQHGVRTPLLLMNSFRTRERVAGDPRPAPGPRGRRPAAGLPAEHGAQAARRRPRPGRRGPTTPTSSGARRATATSTSRCRPPACSTRCASGATATPSSPTPTTSAPRATGAVPAWMAREGIPYVTEVCARTRNDRKGGHLGGAQERRAARAARQRDGRRGRGPLLPGHRPAPVVPRNNLWVDLDVLAARLAERDGILGLPIIVNRKTVDPRAPTAPR